MRKEGRTVLSSQKMKSCKFVDKTFMTQQQHANIPVTLIKTETAIQKIKNAASLGAKTQQEQNQ